MENQLHKGIRQHVVKCFEAANVAGLEDMCKHLHFSVDNLRLKVANLSQSNSNLVMEINSVSFIIIIIVELIRVSIVQFKCVCKLQLFKCNVLIRIVGVM